MIKKEYNWLIETIKKHVKNPIFYLWEIIFIYILWKLWYVYIMFLLYIFISIIILFLKNPSTIYFKQKKINIFINYFKINTLLSLSNNKIKFNFIITYVFFYLFRLIFGISYKIIRLTISLFDCLYNEYIWANIKKKNFKIKIIKKYIENSLENFFYKEFIKSAPIIQKEMTFKFKFFEKKIYILILDK